MIKRDEIEDIGSCFSKARSDERLFVLFARDLMEAERRESEESRRQVEMRIAERGRVAP